MTETANGSDPQELTVNSVDQVSREIREAILTGTFAPGERLKVGELAARFGCSPMPLREALRKLEGEGLVEIELNKGATVRRLDHEYVSDLFELNTELRIFAIRRGMRQMTLARIRTLEDLADRYRDAVEAGDLRRRAHPQPPVQHATGGIRRQQRWCCASSSAAGR